MRALIAGWQIADGEVLRPFAGCVLDGLALRLSPLPLNAGDRVVTVEGAVTWARFDDAASCLEAVVSADGFSVLTQEPAGPGDLVPQLGTTLTWVGGLASVGDYEFDAYGLPDVRQSWRVLSAEDRGRLGVLVGLEAKGA